MRTVLNRGALGSIDLIELANRLVLKAPPFAAISTEHAPNLLKCLHEDLGKELGVRVQLPNLHESDFVGVFSDYGGDESDSAYFTYSFLIVALDGHQLMLERLEAVRRKYGLLTPRREMAFKNLNYGPLERALPAWLQAVDPLPGLLFTLLVAKDAHSVITRNSKQDVDRLMDEGRAAGVLIPRKRETFERYYRIASCVAYWTSLLCREGQQVIWISDNDAAAANPKLGESLRDRVMSMAADLRPDLKVRFAFGSEAEVPNRVGEIRDLVSFADLAAGALAHGVSRCVPTGTPIPASHPGVKAKAGEILRWMAWQRIGLKKTLFLIHPEGSGFRGAFGRVDAEEIPDGMQFVPITP